MSRKKEKVKGAWIGAGAVIAAAVIGGIFHFLGKPALPTITNGNGQVVVGDHNVVQNMPAPKKRAFVDLLDNVDMHLGDNVYPDAFGVAYNPLTQDIYPQAVQGVIYFDKKEKIFLADKGGPTRIGQYLVNKLQRQLSPFDYSAYRFVFAIKDSDPNFERIVAPYRDTDRMVDIGGMTLLATKVGDGNYYHRFAAVGYARSFSLLSALTNSGMDPASKRIRVKVILKMYHGGIRPGQSENFVLMINEYQTTIPSKSYAMRDPQEIVLDIPISAVQLDRSNYLFLYVLPWEEAKPALSIDGKKIRPVHFRDVGVISLGVEVEEL